MARIDMDSVRQLSVAERVQLAENPDEFVQVEIDPVSGAPSWPGDLDVAPDRLHAELAAGAKTCAG